MCAIMLDPTRQGLLLDGGAQTDEGIRFHKSMARLKSHKPAVRIIQLLNNDQSQGLPFP